MSKGVAILFGVILLGAFGDALRDRPRKFINPLFFEVVIKFRWVHLFFFFFLLFLLLLPFFLFFLFLLFLLLLLRLTVVFNEEIVVSFSLDLKVDILVLEKVVEVLNVLSHKSLDDFELIFIFNSYADGLLCAVIRALVIYVHFVEIFLECPFHALQVLLCSFGKK